MERLNEWFRHWKQHVGSIMSGAGVATRWQHMPLLEPLAAWRPPCIPCPPDALCVACCALACRRSLPRWCVVYLIRFGPASRHLPDVIVAGGTEKEGSGARA